MHDQGKEESAFKDERPEEIEMFVEGQREGRSAHNSLTAEVQGPTHRSANTAILLEYTYGILGLVLGFLAILGGITLLLNGVAGSTSWTTRILGAESTLNDAAPGVVLCIVGIFVMWVTKPAVRLSSSPTTIDQRGGKRPGLLKRRRRSPDPPIERTADVAAHRHKRSPTNEGATK